MQSAGHDFRSGGPRPTAMGSGLDLYEIGGWLWLRGAGMPARWPDRVRAEAVHQCADADRAADEMIDLHWTGQLDRSNPV